MNDIKHDLSMTTPQSNKNKLACRGCRLIADEMYPLKIGNDIILMCGICKESLSALLDNEESEIYVSIVNKTFKEGIAINKNAGDVSGCMECGLYETVKYHDDHRDC